MENEDVILNDELFAHIRTEMKARMLLNTYDSDYDKGYKKGFNDAMQWAINCVQNYKNKEGLFQ